MVAMDLKEDYQLFWESNTMDQAQQMATTVHKESEVQSDYSDCCLRKLMDLFLSNQY